MSSKTSPSPVNLSLEDYSLILENSYSNLFATDGQGNIIYANPDAVNVLGCPLEKLLTMNVYELQERGYVSYSMTGEVLRTGKQAIGTYFNNSGKEVATVSTPIYDDAHNIRMVITYSQKLDVLTTFQSELQEQKDKVKTYQEALDYLGRSDVQVIAKDPVMAGIFQSLRQIAQTDSTVMLYGESGVGKEVLANFICQHSNRKDEIYVPINCSTIPHELIESELFGYAKGAFTGARREGKAGLFEVVHKGTLFMDEIGELPMAAQSKLLRVLESGEYRRIGGTTTRNVDVRIVGATNRDLKKMVDDGLFRADLYYRLNVIPINIPPLRVRPLEIEVFAEMFLGQFNRKHGKQRKIPAEMLTVMRRYSWPGNIRELRNVVERYVITGEDHFFTNTNLGDYGGETSNAAPSASAALFNSNIRLHHTLAEVMDEAETLYINNALSQFEGNVAKTAQMLGICRSSLYKKILKNRTEE